MVDDSETVGPDFTMRFFAPKDDENKPGRQAAELADIVHDVITALPDHTVASVRMLFAEMRKAGHRSVTPASGARSTACRCRRLAEVSGKRGAKAIGPI